MQCKQSLHTWYGEATPLVHSFHWLRQILEGPGIQWNFSSHSFRIGVATVAARNSRSCYSEAGRLDYNAMPTNCTFSPLQRLWPNFRSCLHDGCRCAIWLLVVGCSAWFAFGSLGFHGLSTTVPLVPQAPVLDWWWTVVGLPCLPLVVCGHAHPSRLFQAPNPKVILPMKRAKTRLMSTENIVFI